MTRKRPAQTDSIEKLLRDFVDHPWRRSIVITLTCIVGLVTIWPAADEYIALRDYHDTLEHSLEEAEHELAHLGELAQAVDEKAEELAVWQAKVIDTEDTYAFREELVELTRESGCHIRRLDLGARHAQNWEAGDDPLSPPKLDDAHQASPFLLRTQHVRLGLAGPMVGVADFLARLRAEDRFVYPTTVVLRPSVHGTGEVELDMQLILFDFGRVAGGPSAT